MKQILLALMVLLTWCSMAIAQSNSTATAVTVIGVDSTDTDSTVMDIDSIQDAHSNAIISIGTDDDDDSAFGHFGSIGGLVGGAFLIPIVAILATFGFPALVLFFIFFFRYKNRKARYRLAEQALAAGQPLPEGLIKENRPTDQHSNGIRNTFTGIGLFIFLWAITGEFGIGAIGLLVMFMGMGQWLVAYNRGNKEEEVKSESTRMADKTTASTPKTEMKSEVTEIRNEESSEENK